MADADTRSELLFWLGIMRDHTMFQMNALASSEKQSITAAQFYHSFFQRMHRRAERGTDSPAMRNEIMQGLTGFIQFKTDLLRELMTCDLVMNMTPSFINHMINEAMEFETYLTRQTLASEPFEYTLLLTDQHRIWLIDAAGHAAFIAANLDANESLLIAEAQQFQDAFNKLAHKAVELLTILKRTALNDGALILLSEEASDWICKFIDFLQKVKNLRAACRAMATGMLSPLVLEHMMREERHYLNSIKQYSQQA